LAFFSDDERTVSRSSTLHHYVSKWNIPVMERTRVRRLTWLDNNSQEKMAAQRARQLAEKYDE
jgi:hypothetical protein